LGPTAPRSTVVILSAREQGVNPAHFGSIATFVELIAVYRQQATP
jgi:hypothetical protein